MSTPAHFTATQRKALKHNLFVASGDLNHALKPLVNELICRDVPKDKILNLVGTAAQRMLYLTATDVAADCGQDLPEYVQASGTPVRKLVDAESRRCAERLYKDTLIIFPERIPSGHRN